ncbi:transcriptional regulator [Bacteroides sp. UBA939]|uniref:transcriptional regulator n=1 Tax=Bacteroides sp. UBA939 TaxID=1946092 RepID=UPI0025BC7845|nr:transcriptional regulator [Bacteroides sp. UBA939]
MKTPCFIFLLLLLITVPANAEWQRPVTNYTRHTYKADNQNWMLQQHENGWMYVANNNGLLEFDGSGWNLYPMRNAKVRTMKIGKDGRIYIGGIAQFGYFTPNQLGGLDYTCLSDSLQGKSNIGVIWNILENKDKIYFQSDRSLFCWENNRLEYIEYAGEIYTSAILYNKFYIGAAEGIQVMDDKHFKLIPGSDILGRVSGLLPYNGKILIVTRYNGLFTYDGTSIEKYKCAADNFMRRNHIFCAAISQSLLALGSVQDGVCLLDLEKDEMNLISINSGLQNKTVLSLNFDAQNNLWLGLDNGIDCIQLSSPVFSLYGNKPVIGSGYSSCLYQDKLYLGTNQGVYVTVLPNEMNKEIPIRFIPETGGQIWSFLHYDDRLFCASDNGIFVIDGDRIEHLEGLRGVRNIIPLNNHPNTLIAGAYGKYSGLYLLQKEAGRWQVVCRLKNFTYSAKSLMAEESGNVLWVTNRDRGVCRLNLSDDLREVVSFKKYNHKYFPSGYDIFLAKVNNELVVASRYGLWRYNYTEDYLEEYHELENMLDGKVAYTYLTTDTNQNIWYVSDGELKLLRYNAIKDLYFKNPHDIYLKGSLVENYESISTYGEQVITGTEEGFSLIRFKEIATRKEPLAIQIRRVYLTDQRDSLIYGRSYHYEDTTVIIPYKYNSLRIEYNINSYDATRSVLFSYCLSKGSDKGEWSEFSQNRMKEFTGLHEGKYLFSVKLMTDSGQEPVMTSFAFEVLPPWYRTWWSLMIYMAAACLMVFYVYRRIEVNRKRLLMQKELEIYRQKQEFMKESDLKDQTIVSLKEENLQAELRHRSEELIRTTLNIVRKNEILLSVKNEVLRISHSISEENLVSLRRKTLRLVGQINTNIEHDNDLLAFQTTFDSVHHDFFRKLEESFPELSNKEKLLCAYIKMSLLSKEIAPLMNISLRGVEISRYRLRKKLGLGEDENLTEFLQKFSK